MKSKAAKVTLVSFMAAVSLGFLALSIRGRQADSDEKAGDSAADKHGTHSEGVKLDRDTQRRIGIELEALRAAAVSPEVTLYGSLEQDPAEEFVLRSPQTGEIASNGAWPVLGGSVAAGSDIGTIQPRLTAVDQLALNERLASTHSDVEATQSSVETAREEVKRLKELNADDKNVSDKALQEAETRLATEEARLEASRSSERLIASSLRADSNAGSLPLELRQGGQVLEVAAQPGESVASGQILMRVGRFDHLFARLHVPPGQTIDGSATHATIATAGHEEDAIAAQRVAIAGSVDPRYQGETLLFRMAGSKAALRPGQAITARIHVPGPKQRGVLIPAGAILRFQGQNWVYIQAEEDRFVRRAVTSEHPARGGWIATAGFAPGQRVVLSGAQLLLSEEMKSQLESDQD